MRNALLPLVGAVLAAISGACEKKEKAEWPAEDKPASGDTGDRAGEDDLLDLYGDPLPGGAVARLGSVRMLDRALGRLIFSDDGTEIITSSEGAYLIWQTTTAQRTGTLVRENGGHVLAMAPGGRVLATSVYGGQIQLWDYPARAASAVIDAHRREVTDLCFTDKTTLASSSEDRSVKIHALSEKDVETKQEIRGEWESVTTLACSSSGSVVFADSEGKVLVASVADSKATPLGKAPEAVLDVAISGDGKLVAAGVDDGSVMIWKVAAPKKPLVIDRAHPRKVLTVAFDKRGKLITSGGDQFFRVWDPATGDKVAERPAAADVETQLFVGSPDGSFIAAFSELRDGRASEAGRFWLYDSASGKQLLEPDRHHEAITALAFTADGKKVVTASEDHRVLLWDAISANLLDTLATHKGAVRDLVLAGDEVLSAGEDARMHRAGLGGADKIILEPIGGAVHAFDRAPDGSRIVTGDFVGKVSSFSTRTGQRITTHADGVFEQVHDIAFSPDGRYVAVAGAAPEIHVISIASGKTLTALAPDGPRSNYAVAFSPDGKMLATGGDDHIVRLWGTSSWGQLGVLEGSDGTVRAVEFSPSGMRVAAGSSDESAHVWDIASTKQVTTFAGHRGAITDVAFSPDGTKLATASRDETALIWELPPEDKTDKDAAKPAGQKDEKKDEPAKGEKNAEPAKGEPAKDEPKPGDKADGGAQ